MIQFAESFRLHADDGRVPAAGDLPPRRHRLPLAASATLLPAHRRTTTRSSRRCSRPEYPLVVVVHDEAGSQVRNPFEQALIDAGAGGAGGDPDWLRAGAAEGLGVVVPHRAQRAALQEAFAVPLRARPGDRARSTRSAVDTVERFQGGERTVDPGQRDRERPAVPAGRQQVPARPAPADGGAVSRAKQKMILVASRSVFCSSAPTRRRSRTRSSGRTCCAAPARYPLWEGERTAGRQRQHVQVWGNRSALRDDRIRDSACVALVARLRYDARHTHCIRA